MSVFGSLLNNIFLLARPGSVDDGQGGWSESFTEEGSVRGRIRPASTSEPTNARQENAKVTHVLYLFASVEIDRGWRITNGSDVWYVIAVREPSLADEHLEVDCYQWQDSDMETL